MKTRPFLACLLLALVSFVALGTVRADSIVIESPDKNRTWAHAEETSRAFVWDAKAGKFSLFLTYSDINEAYRDSAPQTETLGFSFPGVTWDKESGLFVLTLPDGKVVPVAKRVKKVFFLPQIVLLPKNEAVVQYPDGELKVRLEIHS